MSDPETENAETQASPEGEAPAAESGAAEATPTTSGPAGDGDDAPPASEADAGEVTDDAAISQQIADLEQPQSTPPTASADYVAYQARRMAAMEKYIEEIRAMARRCGVATHDFSFPPFDG